MARLMSQQTLGERLQKWTVEVRASNPFIARQKTRAFVRRNEFLVRNILSPDVVGPEPSQSTFADFFRRETYTVEVAVLEPAEEKWWLPSSAR